MTTSDSPLTLLARALDQTGALIGGTKQEQASLPTPCASWDVRELINHLVGELRSFIEQTADGGRGDADGDHLGDDWNGAYRAAADSLLDAWRAKGSLDDKAEWAVLQQLTEVVMHGWDLAKSTGQISALEPELGAVALDWGRQNLLPEYRGTEKDGAQIGAEVPVPEGASVYDQLAAFGGRDPS